MVKKIDFVLQWIIVLLFVFFLVWFSIKNQSVNVFAFLILPVLAIWQIISSILMFIFNDTPNVKRLLIIYWKIALPFAVIFAGDLLLGQRAIDDDELLPEIIALAALAGCAFSSGYYLYIYRKYFLKKTPE